MKRGYQRLRLSRVGLWGECNLQEFPTTPDQLIGKTNTCFPARFPRIHPWISMRTLLGKR